MGLDDSPIGEIFCLGELLSFICNVLSQWMYSSFIIKVGSGRAHFPFPKLCYCISDLLLHQELKHQKNLLAEISLNTSLFEMQQAVTKF